MIKSQISNFYFEKGVKNTDRKEELLKILEKTDQEITEPLADEVIFLESQLDRLKKLPMLRVNPNNPEQQKSTPAAKLYKEFLQQYVNVIKVLLRQTGDETNVESSALEKWCKERMNLYADSE